MLHLLTEEHRKKVVTEYRKRIIIVSLLGLLCVCATGAIFVLPTYFLSHGKYATVEAEMKILDSELAIKEDSGSSERIKNATLSIEALKIFEKNKNPSVVLDNIVRGKPAGVQIKNFIFTPGEASAMTVDLAGRADTRKSLVQFDQKLKSNPVFDEVVIPLGNFAKEKNIDFSIKLIVSTSTIPVDVIVSVATSSVSAASLSVQIATTTINE
jgi:hypothetical protein